MKEIEVEGMRRRREPYLILTIQINILFRSKRIRFILSSGINPISNIGYYFLSP